MMMQSVARTLGLVLMVMAADATIAATTADSAGAGEPVKISLTRLDCGTIHIGDLNAFSDTQDYPGKSMTLTDSCYLIRHGNEYLMWDTGFPAAMKGKALDAKQPMDSTLERTLSDQLAELHVKPEQVTRVGISHYHSDHTGQAQLFPNATLLIGAKDWATLTATPPLAAADPKPLAHWVSGGGKVKQVNGEEDIFGDGSVQMIDLPGHTPGHHGLLVKLPHTGNVLLSGDLAHFRENYAADGVPIFNTDRADTLASLQRFKKLGANLHAVIIIQHDPRDVDKLPKFPNAAD